MTEKVVCPVCNTNAIFSGHNSFGYSYDCPRCGIFSVTDEAKYDVVEIWAKSGMKKKLAILSWRIRNSPRIKLTTENIPELVNTRVPSFLDRADNILKAIEQKDGYLGRFVQLDESFIAIGTCIDDDELSAILAYLKRTSRIYLLEEAIPAHNHYLKIEPEGWIHLEKLRAQNTESKQGFIAMWFDEEVSGAEQAIRYAVEASGFSPLLIKDKEHAGKICDEIIAEIRRSRFLVADFTGHRGGVYFEAGFAMGLGIPVVWTCRKDQIKDLHFDIRQYNCIDWESEPDLQSRLKNRIMAIIK